MANRQAHPWERSASSRIDATRWRVLAAVAAGFGLASACGGRASDEDPSSGAFEAPDGLPAERPVRRPAPTTAAPPERATQTPGARDRVTAPPPREAEEVCYERDAVEDLPQLGAIAALLPADAFAASGCLSGDYAGWLAGGGCQYDPNGAELRDGECCYVLVDGPPGCGRPFVVDGELRVAALAPGQGTRAAHTGGLPAWAAPPPSLPEALARAIGREWLRDALLEHASVAAFAAFSLSLMAVGAPAALLSECQQASLDEIEHARACFAVAHRYLGAPHHPGPLDLAGLRVDLPLEEVAVRTFLDACVEETVAALTARAQLDVATDTEVRAALERIVEDETRHAELGWKFVAWAVATGGHRVTRALAAAAEGLGAAPPGADPEPQASDRAHLHAAGRLTPGERALVRERTLALVIRPALGGVLDRSRESAPLSAPTSGDARA